MSTFTNTAREVEMPNGDVVVIHNAPTGGENTTSNIKKFKYDDNGHVTESTAADAEDLNLSSYSTPTTGTTAIGTSDDVQTAIGKLDRQSHIDQTNILYSLQTGVKNWMPVDHADLSVEQYLFRNYELALPAGDYIFYLNVSSATATGANFIATNGLDDGTNRTANVVIQPITTGINTANVTVTAGTTHVSLFINGAVNIPEIMLCPKQIWDTINHDFQPFALPNYDLTQLEQQDRNALVEVVDEGAKNIFDLHYESDFTSSSKEGLTATLLPDGTISVTGTPTTTEGGRTFIISQYAASYLRKFNGYYMSGSVAPSGNVTETEVVFELAGSPYTRYAVSTNGNLSSLNFPNTNDLVYFYIRIYCANTTTAVNLTFKPMISTKAKLDVSPSYQSYALPNTDLTQLQAADRAALVEVVDKGAKNIFDITTPNLLRDTAVTPLSNGGATLSCNNAAWTQYGRNVDVEAGKTYKVLVYIDSITGSVGTDFNINITQGSLFLPIVPTDTGEYSVEVTSTSTLLGVAIFINNSETPKSLSINMRMMICSKVDYDINPKYVPYALPNTDLTVLEAEDRAALAEVVDSGAKNLFNYSAWVGCTVSNGTGVFENNGVTLTATSNTVCHTNFLNGVYPEYAKVFVNNGDKITLSWDYEYQSETGGSVHIYANGAVNQYEAYAPITAKQIDYTVPTNVTFLTFCVLIGENNQGKTVKFKDLMICTEAAWKISPKFVPHRPDYDTLISMINAKEPALSTTTMDDGSLDDITVNSFIVCSWNVSSKPISTMGYVRTSVFDANSAMQEFYSFSGDETQSGLVYVRDKQAGVWRSWKMLTNNT